MAKSKVKLPNAKTFERRWNKYKKERDGRALTQKQFAIEYMNVSENIFRGFKVRSNRTPAHNKFFDKMWHDINGNTEITANFKNLFKLPSITEINKQWEQYVKDTPSGSLSKNIFCSRYLKVHRLTFNKWSKRTDLDSEYILFFDKMFAEIEERNLLILNSDYKSTVGMFLLKTQNDYIETDKAKELELREKELDHKIENDKEKLKDKDNPLNITVNMNSDEY